MSAEAEDKGYIVEFIALGNSVKATALDPVSLTEVSIIGTRRTSKQQLSALAIRKLQYVLKKREQP